MIARLLIGVGAALVAASTPLTWFAYVGPRVVGGRGYRDYHWDLTIWQISTVFDVLVVGLAASAVVGALLGRRRALLVSGAGALAGLPLLAGLWIDDHSRPLDAEGGLLASAGTVAVLAGLLLLTRADRTPLEGARRLPQLVAVGLVPLVALLPFVDGHPWYEGFSAHQTIVLAAAAGLAAAVLVGRSAFACALGAALAAMTFPTALEVLVKADEVGLGAWLFALVVAPLALVAAANPLGPGQPNSRTSADTTRSPARPSP